MSENVRRSRAPARARSLPLGQVPVFPDARDVLGSAPPTLPENIVEGKYAHVMQYLATHFHLLREDCLAPLRDGLAAFHRGERSFDVQVYESVRLVGLHCSRTGVVYRVSFELGKGQHAPDAWERSKRLIFGSLLVFSADGFRSDKLLWGTVAHRDADALNAARRSGAPLTIDVAFPGAVEAVARLDPSTPWQMCESASTYFEAYRHVLLALQVRII